MSPHRRYGKRQDHPARPTLHRQRHSPIHLGAPSIVPRLVKRPLPAAQLLFDSDDGKGELVRYVKEDGLDDLWVSHLVEGHVVRVEQVQAHEAALSSAGPSDSRRRSASSASSRNWRIAWSHSRVNSSSGSQAPCGGAVRTEIDRSSAPCSSL